jgi:hypothetical protein
MFQVSWQLIVIYLMFYACVGMAIGAAMGLAIQLAAKVKISSAVILVSGVICVCGFFAGAIGTLMTPWPVTTESSVDGPVTMTSTCAGISIQTESDV